MTSPIIVGIIIIAMEVASFLVKKFAPDLVGVIPIINIFIAFVGSFMFKMDFMTTLAIGGITTLIYDTYNGIRKLMNESDLL